MRLSPSLGSTSGSCGLICAWLTVRVDMDMSTGSEAEEGNGRGCKEQESKEATRHATDAQRVRDLLWSRHPDDLEEEIQDATLRWVQAREWHTRLSEATGSEKIQRGKEMVGFMCVCVHEKRTLLSLHPGRRSDSTKERIPNSEKYTRPVQLHMIFFDSHPHFLWKKRGRRTS